MRIALRFGCTGREECTYATISPGDPGTAADGGKGADCDDRINEEGAVSVSARLTLRDRGEDEQPESNGGDSGVNQRVFVQRFERGAKEACQSLIVRIDVETGPLHLCGLISEADNIEQDCTDHEHVASERKGFAIPQTDLAQARRIRGFNARDVARRS